MAQTSVSNTHLGTGVVGEFYSTEPQGVRAHILNSATEANNVIGRVATYVDDEDQQAGVAASSRFAGIIGFPKILARPTLDSITSIPNGTVADLIIKGYVFVSLPAVAAKGDFVYYSDTTGELSTVAPDAAAPAGSTRLPGGEVAIYNVTEPGIAVIYVDHGGDKSDSTGA